MTNRPLKKILCFGDSNTWGYIPTIDQEDQRYPPNIRWTGILQSKLPECLIIEEGLNSRTTNIDDPDYSGKNGLEKLPGILHRHQPVDLVVMMLGTNDLKKKFDRRPEEIAQGLESLVRTAVNLGVPHILISSPPIPKLASIYESYRYPELESKARQLAPLYASIAQKQGCLFINAADTVISSDIDGAHLDPHEHEKFASIIFEPIQQWLSEQVH